MANKNGIMLEQVKILAYDFETGKFIGEYDSIQKAARKLFIKYPSSIWQYLNKGLGLKNKLGVKSYQGGKYHFEIKDKV